MLRVKPSNRNYSKKFRWIFFSLPPFKPDFHAISKMVQYAYSTFRLDLHFVFEQSALLVLRCFRITLFLRPITIKVDKKCKEYFFKQQPPSYSDYRMRIDISLRFASTLNRNFFLEYCILVIENNFCCRWSTDAKINSYKILQAFFAETVSEILSMYLKLFEMVIVGITE